MTSKKTRIGLVPIGEVAQITSKSVAAHITGYLDLDVDILPALDHPSYAHDQKRVQYDAGAILKAVESEPFHGHAKVIGVLDVDLFVPILTHVFGEAKQAGKCALVSVHRLKKNTDGSTAPLSLQLERAAKVALHELGHLFDLHHCMDSKCLMHFSGDLDDLDKTPLYFCRYCSIFLRDAL
ncbi:MAG: archaemetzincin family Zn-dependent metalloprotease [Desulfobacteraceae bacterium]|jgi:archaemetzincin